MTLMRFLALLVLLLSLFACSREQPLPTAQDRPPEQSSRDLEEMKKSLKGDVRVKLKKESKGTYSWEISGRDAQEVLKTNEVLKKKLSE
jgi:hypothetical protein